MKTSGLLFTAHMGHGPGVGGSAPSRRTLIAIFFFPPTHNFGCTLLRRSFSHALIQLTFLVIRGRGGRIAPQFLPLRTA